jgi:hypothetical protein
MLVHKCADEIETAVIILMLTQHKLLNGGGVRNRIMAEEGILLIDPTPPNMPM